MSLHNYSRVSKYRLYKYRVQLYSTLVQHTPSDPAMILKGLLTYMRGGCIKVAFPCKSISVATSDDDYCTTYWLGSSQYIGL